MKKTSKGIMIGLLIGASLMFTTTSFADSIKEFILKEADYSIIVNDNLYQSSELPILNYEGYTYVPLRAITELLGVDISWDQQLRRVEISHEKPVLENKAFRNILVSGSQGTYTVAGQARIFEAVLQYEVEDGHFIFQKGFEMASEGAPEWGIFTIDIQIPEGELPDYGQLRLILFEESAKDGSRINELSIPLENFNE
jgi:hypothetical protein